MVCAVCIFVLFKDMEMIVHGQLYYYGLRLSPDWADPYRICTWLIYLCLGLPTVLGGLALVSSFLKVEKVPRKKETVPQRPSAPRGGVKVEPRQMVKEVPRRVENDNDSINVVGIACPHCKKVFGRALVMLDFRGGKNRMVSVCPYCNHVLGYTDEETGVERSFFVAMPDEKAVHQKLRT